MDTDVEAYEGVKGVNKLLWDSVEVEITDTPMPDSKADFWEDEKFEFLGKLSRNFLAIAIVCLALIGGIAGKLYSDTVNLPQAEVEVEDTL